MMKKIMIIEDDQDIRANLSAALEHEGYKVDTASNGREALNLLKQSTPLPALIILDLMMPVFDGYQFRKEQELDPNLAGIPIVVTTAGGNIEAKKFKVGAKAFLKKPFDLDEVFNVVKRYA